MAPHPHSRDGTMRGLTLGLGLLAAGAAVAVLTAPRPHHGHRLPDDAPGRTARRRHFGEFAVVGRTVTIARPRSELFAFWRDFPNLSRFMENVEQIEPAGEGQWKWTIKAPLGQRVELVTEIVNERDGELIAWRSVEGSQIEAEGRVTFRDAAEGRGTLVEAIIAYKAPGGELGRLVAKLFGREPNVQGRRELKRFKMLMETGEIATNGTHQND